MKDQRDLAQSFLERCESSDSLQTLGPAFRQAVEQLGFRYFALCSHVDPLDPPPQSIMLHNYPLAWVRIHSQEQLHRIDPVFRHAESHPLPFNWNSTFRKSPVTALQSKLLAAAHKFGIAHGYTIPLTLSWAPGWLPASCSVVPASDNLDRWNYRVVELMANYLFAAVHRSHARHTIRRATELSVRERQCLILAANGNDDRAIGERLGVSHVTAHTYIERTKQQLGVCTRVQAVVQALATGQITFGDILRAREPERRRNVRA